MMNANDPHDLTFVLEGSVPPFDNTSIWETWENVRFRVWYI